MGATGVPFEYTDRLLLRAGRVMFLLGAVVALVAVGLGLLAGWLIWG